MFQMPIFEAALLSGCIGLLSAYLASRQGRNPYMWFLIGAFFGLLGMLAIFFSPRKKMQPVPTQPAAPAPEWIIGGPSDKFWYYLDAAHSQVGPMSFTALNKAWKSGTVHQKTFVWHEDLTDWKPLQECLELKK